jgi:DNA repair protein RadC
MKIKDLPKIERPREKHVGAGHRKRLRDRFLQSELNGFLDYEIIELLLTLGTPQRDCKSIAKDAVRKFGGLHGVLEASPEELQQIRGLGPHNIFGLKLFQALSERYAKEKLPRKVILDSPKTVVSYLQEKIGKEKKEHFLILALDSRNNLIKDYEISVGTLNASIVHPREVFKAATQALAAQVIIAHNHPSGDPEPSEGDLLTTKGLVEAGKILEIKVVDHIIITRDNFLSFKERKLL